MSEYIDEYVETIHCLKQTFSVSDKCTRSQSVNRLKEMCSNYTNLNIANDFITHVSYLFCAIKDGNIIDS